MKILLADDHPLFLDGVKTLLTTRGIDVVGTARDGLEALEKARELRPQVVLMDLRMPQMDGLAATRLIKAELPDIQVVVLTMSDEDEDLFEALKCGAAGYLLKTEETDRFVELLVGITRGEVPFSPTIAARVLKELAHKGKESKALGQVKEEKEGLTVRQSQVLALVAEGLAYKEVGEKLFLSERTIKYHMGEIIERLHLENRWQAIEFARRMKMQFHPPEKP